MLEESGYGGHHGRLAQWWPALLGNSNSSRPSFHRAAQVHVCKGHAARRPRIRVGAAWHHLLIAQGEMVTECQRPAVAASCRLSRTMYPLILRHAQKQSNMNYKALKSPILHDE